MLKKLLKSFFSLTLVASLWARADSPPPGTAVKYPLLPKQISSVIVGTTSFQEADKSLAELPKAYEKDGDQIAVKIDSNTFNTTLLFEKSTLVSIIYLPKPDSQTWSDWKHFFPKNALKKHDTGNGPIVVKSPELVIVLNRDAKFSVKTVQVKATK